MAAEQAISPAAARVTACTVVARNYLPAARVLARSYREHHPDHEFVIAVIDADTPAEAAGPDLSEVTEARVIGPAEFGIDKQDYLRMATAYDVTELATAVKPYVLRELRRAGRDVVIYLDPDITVFRPMPEVAELAMRHQLVLTPHFTEPLPRDGLEPDESVIMGTGVFNLGFVATGPGSEEFLDFWAERLRHDAIVAPEQQLFTDQRWVDQVPALFEHTVLRDPGFNVAYWNLHERPLAKAADGTVTAGGSPLRFFHFSGYRPERPWLLTLHCARRPRVLLSDHPVLRELCDSYGAALREAGYAETLEAIPYGYATFPDGTPLTRTIRRVFRAGWVLAEGPDVNLPSPRLRPDIPPHAFGPDGGTALREWLTSPEDQAQEAAGLHRLAMAAWHSRVDLQLAFPKPTGPDAEAFRHWCAGSGVQEGLLPEWAVPEDPPPMARPVDEFGVNLAGYLTAELGLGEMGRIVHEAITRAGIDVISVVEERSLSNRTGVRHKGTLGRPRFPVTVLAVNADQTPVILANYPELAHERYVIGLWAWELEDFPSWQHDAFDMVDEVWTISEFCREAIAAAATVPVKTIPVPVRDPGAPVDRKRKPGDPVRFLFAFDFNSVGERKNPWGLVTAFQRAFPEREDVRLTIKAINGDKNPHNAERLRVLAAGDDRIELVERYLSVEELDELYRSADCYVSLHRSEGFGLTVAEAMARGLPVISTDYSSTTEFFDERTGWPIPYRLIPVGKGNFPYHADAVWADPDLDAAAAAMREVADDPEEAARRGRAAREHVLRTRTMKAASEWMATQLRQAYQKWQARRAAAAAQPAVVDPLDPLRAARGKVEQPPDPHTASRLPGAPAMRKAVLRVLDHYDVHQRGIHSAIADSVEQSAALLLSRIESLEARLAAQETMLSERIQAEVDRAAGPAVKRAGHAMREVTSVRDQLEQLRAAQEHVASTSDLDKLNDRVQQSERWTHAMFASRDERADTVEHTLQTLRREIDAVHEAARMLHAPVPDGMDVVLCDAGALLLPQDTVVREWIAYHRSWEEAEAALLRKLMSERPGAFVDVGAHVGYHTLRLLRSCPQVEKAVAVEVHPTNFACLERNVAANLPTSIRDRVHAIQVAAWDADGVVELISPDSGNSGDHRVRAVRSADSEVGVPAVRLDQVPEIRDASVTVVKVDLQGRDHRALAGLAEVLRRDKPEVVCEFCPDAIEELGDDPRAALTGYRELGYVPVIVGTDGPEEGSVDDAELVRLARAEETGFLTLWLHPR